jgi:drug/metabolite transporter (DMT)-like permease
LLYLVAALIFNVLVSAILKMFSRYGINSLQAIVTNYCICVVTGCLFTGNMPFTAATLHTSWLPWAVLMGVSFITIFNLTAHCTNVDGMTTTVMASKLSLVIPVICSVLLYNDKLNIGKVTGIMLAFPAVYLSTRSNDKNDKPLNLFWPALLFVLSGSLDTLVNFIQASFLPTADAQAACTIVCFATAGATGIIIVLVLLALKKITFEWKNIIAGICLGIPNFFSIYYLVRGLNSNSFQSSATIPLFNISILVATTLAAMLFFKEKAGKWRLIGLALASLAILLIAFGDIAAA